MRPRKEWSDCDQAESDDPAGANRHHPREGWHPSASSRALGVTPGTWVDWLLKKEETDIWRQANGLRRSRRTVKRG